MVHPGLERTYLERKNKYFIYNKCNSKVEDFFCFKVCLKQDWKKFHNYFGLSEIESDYENNLLHEESFYSEKVCGPLREPDDADKYLELLENCFGKLT